ncbi:hypothetical protein [Neisseria chenwenguii]|uniref:Uncharacterized protein n=1 Tax=Neisseria chenwenguii TaxID=1853278 RepID=A0A220S3F8_9NEIS|nr:hypothetical protein [Neisseria chenwenguii]ASK27735.1 hypothetical protein BG910_08280 [Neisseria chenwenguii]
MTSKSQTILTYADALNNANTIKQNLDKPSSERTSLDGLDSSIAAISLAATTAAEVASATNSSPSGAANAMGAMSTGIAFQLNGAAASASLAATYVYMKQGQFDKAASTSLGVVSGLAGMLQVASSTLPGVNPVEGVAGATGGGATALNLAISNPQLLKAVSEEISRFYDKNLENFRDWFLPKLGDNINKVLDPNTWKDWFNKLKDDLLPDLPSEKE